MIDQQFRVLTERVATTMPRRGIIRVLGKGVIATGVALASWQGLKAKPALAACQTCSCAGDCQCPFCAFCGICNGCDAHDPAIPPPGCTFTGWCWNCCINGVLWRGCDYKCPNCS